MSVQQVSVLQLASIVEKATHNQQHTFNDVIIHQGNSPEVGNYTLVNTPEGNSYLIQ